MSENYSPSPDELRSRMRDVRSELRRDATTTAAAAKRYTDWHFYVKEYPWATAAAVAALGFLIVPKREERPMVDQQALEKLIAQKRVVVIPQATQAESKKSFGSAVVAMIAATAGRAAMDLIKQRVAAAVAQGPPVTEERIRTPK